MPKKTISVAGKSVTITQLVVAIVVAVFAIGGSLFGILQAEDRWNQRFSCIQNAERSDQLEKDFTAGLQQMFYQQNVRFEEQRLQSLYDQLGEAKAQLARDPNNQVLRDRVYYLIDQLEKAKQGLKELHEKRVD